jgi:DMSO/TMAO reductase YedYZ molybdopterin-dependent catalytic subunit
MGNLKPGAAYIYERAEGVTYAREVGSLERTAIGWDYDAQLKMNQRKEIDLWKKIWQAAKTNPVLQTELDRVIMLYHLSKDNGQE